jgi:hypothetical protein
VKLARFQHNEGKAEVLQGMRGAETGRARADDREVDGRGRGMRTLFSLSPFFTCHIHTSCRAVVQLIP